MGYDKQRVEGAMMLLRNSSLHREAVAVEGLIDYVAELEAKEHEAFCGTAIPMHLEIKAGSPVSAICDLKLRLDALSKEHDIPAPVWSVLSNWTKDLFEIRMND